ncbi:MAG: hypothetical protein M1326_06710 [Cyanobacteria bacterium]|nr:hypothetical protein [Cyanobacteriota bacterium]
MDAPLISRKYLFPPYHNELSLIGSTNSPFSFIKALRLLSSKRINVKEIISHKLKLENIVKAFNMVGSKNIGKILIIPNS